MSIKKDEETLKSNCPHVVVGTPGRILALCRDRSLNLKNIKHFILDECDKMLEQLGGWALREGVGARRGGGGGGAGGAEAKSGLLPGYVRLPPPPSQTCGGMCRRCSR